MEVYEGRAAAAQQVWNAVAHFQGCQRGGMGGAVNIRSSRRSSSSKQEEEEVAQRRQRAGRLVWKSVTLWRLKMYRSRTGFRLHFRPPSQSRRLESCGQTISYGRSFFEEETLLHESTLFYRSYGPKKRESLFGMWLVSTKILFF